jgi:hypothetical protein
MRWDLWSDSAFSTEKEVKKREHLIDGQHLTTLDTFIPGAETAYAGQIISHRLVNLLLSIDTMLGARTEAKASIHLQNMVKHRKKS